MTDGQRRTILESARTAWANNVQPYRDASPPIAADIVVAQDKWAGDWGRDLMDALDSAEAEVKRYADKYGAD